MALRLRHLRSSPCRALLVGLCLSAAPGAWGADLFPTFPAPRQTGLGGAGVALAERGQAARFNPAMTSLAFPPGDAALAAAYARGRAGDGTATAAQDAPLFLDYLRLPAGLGYPAWFRPDAGYIGFDHQSWSPSDTARAGTEGSLYTLTLATPPEVFGGRVGRPDLDPRWTFGLTIAYYQVSGAFISSAADSSRPLRRDARGFAFDVGAAWRVPVLFRIPGLEVDAGLALRHLGAPARFDTAGRRLGPAEPLPAAWRAGAAVAYSLPWGARRRGGLQALRLLLAYDIERAFAARDGSGEARPAWDAFVRQFDTSPARYWRGMAHHVGGELEALGILSGRIGRSAGGSEGGAHATYGFGARTPVLWRRLVVRYDYGRSREEGRSGLPGSEEHGLEACWHL